MTASFLGNKIRTQRCNAIATDSLVKQYSRWPRLKELIMPLWTTAAACVWRGSTKRTTNTISTLQFWKWTISSTSRLQA